MQEQTSLLYMIQTFKAAVAQLFATTTMNAQQSISLDINVKSTNKVPNTKIVNGAEFTINSVTCDMSNQKGFNYILGIATADGLLYQGRMPPRISGRA